MTRPTDSPWRAARVAISVTVLLLGPLAVGVASAADAPSAAGAASPRAVAGGIVQCPSGDTGDTCADMPCPSGKYCGSVVAGPTSNLGDDQYVFLNFSGFEPGDTGITVYYCSDPGAAVDLSATPTCVASDTGSSSDAPLWVPIYPTSSSTFLPPGTASASMQAGEVSAPDAPFTAQEFHPTVHEPGFYCDGTTANACAIVVTDAAITPGDPTSSAANSVVIPVTFEGSSTGCPGAAVVSTESEFGIETLMPELARLSCAADPATAVIPFETATDGLQAVTDLATGSQQVAFTEDPEALDQQSVLARGDYSLIPVALSANVVSFFDQLNLGANFSLDQMDLTPTMAAGLLTSAPNYNFAQNVDDLDPCSGASLGKDGKCLNGPGPCYGEPTCSLYSQLNFVNGFNQFTTYQSFERSDHSGVTDALFSWLCTAPVVPLDFGTHPVEKTSGAQELELGLSSRAPGSAPLATCPDGVDQMPSIADAPASLVTVNDPSQQALKAYQAVFDSGTSSATAAFADMNWAEARYYGMNVASLQNAAGAFVAPTVTSLDAAVSGATANPDGSLSFHNSASDAAAYPMPSIIYAVIPSAPMAQSDATAVTELLTQLLDLTGGSETSDLPQGFVPLPPSLAAEASKDVAADIHAAESTSNSSAGSGGSSTGGSTSPPPAGPSAATPTPAGEIASATGVTTTGDLEDFAPSIAALAGLPASGLVRAAGALPGVTSSGQHRALPLLGPALPGYSLAASRGSALVPGAFAAGSVAVLLGMLLMSGGRVVRRRRRAQRTAAASAVAGAGEGAEEGRPL